MKSFLTLVFSEITSLWKDYEGIDCNTDEIDIMAYKSIKDLISRYEVENPDIIQKVESYANYDREKRRHCYEFTALFIELRHGTSLSTSTPYADFTFEAIDGPFKGKEIHHQIYHTIRFPNTFRSENTFVKTHLRYTGPYDAKMAAQEKMYEKRLKSEMERKYVYKIVYYPPEGEFHVPNMDVIDEETRLASDCDC